MRPERRSVPWSKMFEGALAIFALTAIFCAGALMVYGTYLVIGGNG